MKIFKQKINSLQFIFLCFSFILELIIERIIQLRPIYSLKLLRSSVIQGWTKYEKMIGDISRYWWALSRVYNYLADHTTFINVVYVLLAGLSSDYPCFNVKYSILTIFGIFL